MDGGRIPLDVDGRLNVDAGNLDAENVRVSGQLQIGVQDDPNTCELKNVEGKLYWVKKDGTIYEVQMKEVLPKEKEQYDRLKNLLTDEPD